VITDSYGLIAGAGAEAENVIVSDVLTKVGNGANVSARNISLDAQNTLDKPAVTGTNIYAARAVSSVGRVWTAPSPSIFRPSSSSMRDR